MSHILSDGSGFLQYLYLLAALYNGASPGSKLQNTRNISSLLKNIRVQPPTEQTKCGRRIDVVPLRPFNKGTRFFCLNSTIAPNDLTAIHAKAKKSSATLNHAFIAAYARVIARLQNTDKIVLPCPADLRRFQPEQDNLTIANMTGIYKRIIVEINPRHTFSETLSQVCIEMNLQKDRCRCFAGMRLLNVAFHKTPRFILKKAIRAGYPLFPVSYTNMGIIEHEKLYFQDCYIKKCCLTGTYRFPPDFQISVSTFRNTCTLNCTLIGVTHEQEQGENAGKVKALKLELKKAEDKRMDVDQFLESVRRYTNAVKVTKRMVTELIDHIEVYHAEKDENGVATQRITILYNCIGAFDVSHRRKSPRPTFLWKQERA